MSEKKIKYEDNKHEKKSPNQRRKIQDQRTKQKILDKMDACLFNSKK